MKEAIQVLAPVFICVLLAVGLGFGIHAYNYRDKFEVGDCVAQVYENEFTRNVTYVKILKVGKTHYLVDSFFKTKLKSWLNDHDTTDPKNCEKK